MFKNLVRSEKYLITAVLYLPKNMDTKMVSFLSSGAGTAMLDDLDKRGYRVFCVSLNFELNAELTNTYSCKPANSLLELMKRDLRLISELGTVTGTHPSGRWLRTRQQVFLSYRW